MVPEGVDEMMNADGLKTARARIKAQTEAQQHEIEALGPLIVAGAGTGGLGFFAEDPVGAKFNAEQPLWETRKPD